MSEAAVFNGIVLIDKPEGMTSFSVVSRLRKILHVKKIGHAGTLDPFATGLLTLAVGRATRVLRYMENYDKTYRATMVLGKKTSTGDPEGEVVGGRIPDASEREALRADDAALIRKAIASMTGTITQVPSKYSAIKIAGRPAYDYARKGQEVVIPERRVTIFGITVESIREEEETFAIDMTVSCSKGTYIRTLCEDIGEKLGLGAYCRSLRRLQSGQFEIGSAFSLEMIEKMAREEDFSCLLPEDLALQSLPRVQVSSSEAWEIGNGKKLDFSPFKDRMRDIEGVLDGERVLACCQERPVAIIYVSEEQGKLQIREERVLEQR